MKGAYPFPEELRDACGVGFIADPQGHSRRAVLPLALEALARLGHRGAVDADGRTGDGAGVMTQIPYALLRHDLERLGLGSRRHEEIAVGLVFLPRPLEAAACARLLLATSLAAHGLVLEGWRIVPIDESSLGEKARNCRPDLLHAIVTGPAGMSSDEFEHRLFAARKETEERAENWVLPDFYIASLSHRTIVYKALVRACDLAHFYKDLTDPAFETWFALFHQRFSTNTLPSWSMTQPFRMVAHNGEINTIAGNRSWMRARGCSLPAGASDSASLDEALTIITNAGRDIAQGVNLTMPPAWENDAGIDCQERSFYEYQAMAMEPWDGPALVVFSDGNIVGAALDRNGLRPARSVVTSAGVVMVASEAGVLDVGDADVVHRGRVGPGGMVAIDLESGRFLHRKAIVHGLAARQPYEQWLTAQRVLLAALPHPTSVAESSKPSMETLRAFGYTQDELQLILGPMNRGAEPLGSMGDDTPLSVLSSRSRPLFSYFKQRFAQVTNPPIDSLRESMVMSLDSRLGAGCDLFAEGPLPGPCVSLPHPLLDTYDVEALLSWKRAGWRPQRLSLLFRIDSDLPTALEQLLVDAAGAVREGATCLILSDRGIDGFHAAIPSLLAVSAIHQDLVRCALRLATSIVADTGEVRDEHGMATLLGFGADAICPWLALALAGEAGRLYIGAMNKGLLKILAKMGVSTLRSYRGAQLFEAVGISDELIDRHFAGTASFVGGIGLEEIGQEALDRQAHAFSDDAPAALEDAGIFRYRRQGEAHAYEPRVVGALHKAIRSGQPMDYQTYSELVRAREPAALRDLLEFRAGTPIALDEVEPAMAIVRRFMTAAMSLGALSFEAQQVLATAMNRLGARSNSGEGGEPSEVLRTISRNRIKQVASGRFGVTAEYLISADELQIKIAQGSKPGEGGQLPGQKVTPFIARVRHASPGTTLISPPPHHDIYSIEDLAQLVYDLKRINPIATVSVKLVSSAGIGTIAVGVAKSCADAIEISGHDGGTGASPLGSIKNAGTPWELGLSEAQQALVRAGLRERVRLQVNGGLKTGRDVVMAALLGAEEYGFGTAALVAAGCVMARQCHLNSCPVGIATQREELRAKFTATADDVIRFFIAVADEVRGILAVLGFRAIDEIIGRTDLLESRVPASGKASTLRLDRILASDVAQTPLSDVAQTLLSVPSFRPPQDTDKSVCATPRRCMQPRNDPPHSGARIDEEVLGRLRFSGPPVAISFPITNGDRSVGARIAGELARNQTGGRDVVRLLFRGSAGQSFGAFCVKGMRLVLEGEANDYVGKSMSGGEIVIRPHRSSREGQQEIIAGNTILYGATGGNMFVAGGVGERFAVRNSGAFAVVEGTGDHACEYMTAGVVVILGRTGRNVGAGMSGGAIFAIDSEETLRACIHPEWVRMEDTLSAGDERWLRDAISRHGARTGSRRAKELLASWSIARRQFRRLWPAAEGSIAPLLPRLREPHTIVRTAAQYQRFSAR